MCDDRLHFHLHHIHRYARACLPSAAMCMQGVATMPLALLNGSTLVFGSRGQVSLSCRRWGRIHPAAMASGQRWRAAPCRNSTKLDTCSYPHQ
eukprot:5132383-Amphidinium_carterae.2